MRHDVKHGNDCKVILALHYKWFWCCYVSLVDIRVFLSGCAELMPGRFESYFRVAWSYFRIGWGGSSKPHYNAALSYLVNSPKVARNLTRHHKAMTRNTLMVHTVTSDLGTVQA